MKRDIDGMIRNTYFSPTFGTASAALILRNSSSSCSMLEISRFSAVSLIFLPRSPVGR